MMDPETKRILKNCNNAADIFEALPLIVGKEIDLNELDEDDEEEEKDAEN